jgi:hypothetical protein
VKAILVGAALVTGLLGQVHACGVCAEDKIAATYDHRSVREALARGRVVVYCDLAGLPDAGRVRTAAARVRGVDAGSVRVSAQPGALSFVLDPKQQSARSAVLALQAALPPGAKVSMLKVEGAPTPAP